MFVKHLNEFAGQALLTVAQAFQTVVQDGQGEFDLVTPQVGATGSVVVQVAGFQHVDETGGAGEVPVIPGFCRQLGDLHPDPSHPLKRPPK